MSNSINIFKLMKQEQITAAEVQLLRENAEKERARHAQVLEQLKWVKNGTIKLSSSLQMEIVMRKRESEVLALLDVYAENYGKAYGFKLADEVQLFIYDDKNNLPKSKDEMLHNTHICYAIEKRIFDDDKPLFFNEGDHSGEFYPKFSPEGEKYIVDQTLSRCLKNGNLTNSLYFLRGYTKRHELSPVAQNALMDYISEMTVSDSIIDELESFVLSYMANYKNLCFPAQQKLIRSGNHKLIMYYITNSLASLKSQEVIDELIARGDKEEITAYFERYAHED